MRYLYIAFDVDGTLIDTQDTFTYSFARTIKDLKGEIVPVTELLQYFGLPSMEAVRRVGFDNCEAALELWERHYRRMAATLSHPFEGVGEAIERFAAAGVQMGVVTSRSREEYEADSNLDPLRHHFKVVVCADDTRLHKPDAAPALAFAAAAGVPECECLYVGDTLVDALCASGAGMDFALADWRDLRPADIPCRWRFSSADALESIEFGE